MMSLRLHLGWVSGRAEPDEVLAPADGLDILLATRPARPEGARSARLGKSLPERRAVSVRAQAEFDVPSQEAIQWSTRHPRMWSPIVRPAGRLHATPAAQTLLGLEDGDLAAATGELEGRTESGEASADDCDTSDHASRIRGPHFKFQPTVARFRCGMSATAVKNPTAVAVLVLTDETAPEGQAADEVDAGAESGDLLAETIAHVGRLTPPHDRSHVLFAEGAPSEWYLASARRWVTTMLADEGVHAPVDALGRRVTAEIRTKAAGRLAGLTVADLLMREWMPGATFHWLTGEGADVEAGTCILQIEACRHQLLVCERPILNILGRLSGIATNTAKWISHSQIPIAATRKTTWGVLDKAAVHVGGGLTHRLNRPDALMLKENDLASTAEEGERGTTLVRSTLRDLPLEHIGAFVTIEVRTLDEALVAAETWAERMLDSEDKHRLVIMLDNMGAALSKDAALDLAARGLREYVWLEASGNIHFDELESWQSSGVDVLSTSGLHRAATPLDLTCIFQGA